MFSRLDDLKDTEIKSETLREYLKFKNENPDGILMFQIGKFFETFFEDAKIFSEITNAQLETRTFKTKIEVLQSGINKNSINAYVKKLLNNGVKINICCEYIDENGKFYRELTRKYTQGTIVEDEFLEAGENNYLMAIYRYDDIYNISYADVSTGQIYKTKADIKEYKNETDKISPNEILISRAQDKIFKNLISKYNVTILDDGYFKGEIEQVIDKYCKDTQKKFKTKLDKVITYTPEKYMSLDELTRKNLELTRTNYLLKKKGSILWFLNYTKTSMGLRLLKKFLNEPLLSKKDIVQRQNAVEEFVNNPSLIDETQKILEQFSDLSRLCAKLSNTTVLPKDLLNLARNAYLLEDFKKIISNLNSDLFKIDNSKLNKVLKLANTINAAIKKEPSSELKSGDIINDGYNSNLDYLRYELNEIHKKIENFEKLQREKLNIKSLKIAFSTSIGYYIEIPAKDSLKVPNEYYKKNSTSKLVRYSTDELSQYEENIGSLKYKINQLEYDIYKKLRVLSSDFVDLIRFLASDIALIDVIVSCAKCAVENNLVKPDIEGEAIVIEEGYHPSLLKLNNEIIKNDTNLMPDSMMILTGANMSGKSTYLKHNAIICLLSQIGSYIPAKSAKLPITDKIFFRQNSSDDIINNNSSFMVEMNDLKYIIDNATASSLILLDEPAKSTNAKEGGAISRAFCEYILSKYKTKTIIATHNLELTKLENKYPNRVRNYVIGINNKMAADRKIRQGIINSSYAIDTALLAQLPDEIIDMAKEYIEE